MKIQSAIILAGIVMLGLISCRPSLPEKDNKVLINTNWIFREVGKFEWLNATVPGCVHTDLLENKKIEDPFFKVNEKKLQWIDKKDWEYKTTFSLGSQTLAKQNIRLRFDGLDTRADVYLNDSLIIKADNMFREWKVNCKSLLKSHGNELRVVFHSPTKTGLERLKKLGFALPATNDQSELGGMGNDKVSVFLRKAPYSFGWDWGPRLVTSGIWRSVYLETWDNAKIDNAHYQVKSIAKDKALLLATFEILSSGTQKIKLTLNETKNNLKLINEEVELHDGSNVITREFEIKNPKLWWSNGLGEPYLYSFTANIENYSQSFSKVNSSFGIRTIKVIQKPDSVGKSFYFELNGIPVFMKGSDYIPNDIFPTRVTDEKYEMIIKSAVETNQNMLRLWGGGIYENDIFYDLCDKYGILVWHDFMFACSMYPVDSVFNENIKQEFRDNIKRLRNHPCIALWCGNNEMDSGWAEGNDKGGWGWRNGYTAAQHKYIWDGYMKIFYETLPNTIKQLDTTRFYWPSSPIADYSVYGQWTLKTGDLHYWGVWHGKEPFEMFREKIGRFMSEYGFQSFPSFNAVKTYSDSSDWNIESEVMASHQRSGVGNMLIKKYMDMYYKTPKDFKSFLYVSQVQQAEAIKMAIEAHRVRMPVCMGTLYWQLNDCWPVASWASVDYYGEWKALHYYARKAFSKILVSPRIEGKNFAVYAVSDSLNEFNGDLEVKLMDFDGKVIFTNKFEVVVNANTSTPLLTFPVDKLAGNANKNKLVLVTTLYNNNKVLSSNILYLSLFKDLELEKPKLETSIEQINGGEYMVHLKTDKLAKNVYLSIDSQGSFSENYFDLIPGETASIKYTSNITIVGFDKKLKIQTLVDTY